MDKSKLINKKNTFIFLFILVYCFLLFLNIIFPTQSDDIGRKIGGLKAAINSYLSWNGRFGELLLVSFGSYLSTTPFFAPLNSLFGTILIFLIFFNITGHLPENNIKQLTQFFIIPIFILVDPVSCFGSMFYWAAGSFNYLLPWTLLLFFIIPYNFYFRNIRLLNEKILIFYTLAFGFFAGWSTEFAIVFIFVLLVNIPFSFYKKNKLPKWYYFGLCSLIIGWLILYCSPGIKVRSSISDDYISLTTIIQSGILGIYNKILEIFIKISASLFYENFLLLSFFTSLTSFKINKKYAIFAIINTLLMYVLLKVSVFPKLGFLLYSIIIFLLFSFLINKYNTKISYYYKIICILLIIELLFLGSTIQITVPRRACFQFTLINIILIFININLIFSYFKKNKIFLNICFITILIIFISITFFVSTECLNMHKKWNQMVNIINIQKNNDVENIIISKNTFISNYWSYGDWGNPVKDENDWVNVRYSEFFDVKTISIE